MMKDFKSWLMALIFALPVLLLMFIGFLYFGNCGFNNDCTQASLAQIIHTPIPTLIPATIPAPPRALFPGNQAQGSATPAPAGSTSGVPQPSNPGGPGEAINLKGLANSGAQVFAANCAICHGDKGVGGIANPGSDDGTTPPLNPIDPLLKDKDLKTYITNLDLFIEHGSKPAGTNPVFSMPAWGDTESLTDQQIADVIAYLISLNP